MREEYSGNAVVPRENGQAPGTVRIWDEVS